MSDGEYRCSVCGEPAPGKDEYHLAVEDDLQLPLLRTDTLICIARSGDKFVVYYHKR